MIVSNPQKRTQDAHIFLCLLFYYCCFSDFHVIISFMVLKLPEVQRQPLHILIASALASIASTVITNPIEVRKINQHMIPITCPQYPQKCNAYIVECLCNNNSIKHLLFSGLSVVVPQLLISNAIFIQLYEFQRNILIKSNYFKEHAILSTVLSASSSRFITSVLMAPMEAKRIRLGAHTDTKASLSLKQHYTSTKITVQRDVLYSITCWTIVESLRNYLAGRGQYRDRQKTSTDILKFNIFTGLAGAACAATITNPIDVVKTRIQSKSLTNKSTFRQLVKVLKTEGIKGLYLGVRMRLLKTSLHLSVYLTLYQELLNLIKRKSQSH